MPDPVMQVSGKAIRGLRILRRKEAGIKVDNEEIVGIRISITNEKQNKLQIPHD